MKNKTVFVCALTAALAVSAMAGCTKGGKGGDGVKLDVESEKIATEAEWIEAFDYDMTKNYVCESVAISQGMEMEQSFEVDRVAKKAKAGTSYGAGRDLAKYIVEKDGKVYSIMQSYQSSDSEGGWEEDEWVSNFEEAIEEYDMLSSFFETMFGSGSIVENLSYSEFTYDESEKVYEADFSGSNVGIDDAKVFTAKVWITEGKVYAISVYMEAHEYETDPEEGLVEDFEYNMTTTFVFGVADVQVPAFDL